MAITLSNPSSVTSAISSPIAPTIAGLPVSTTDAPLHRLGYSCAAYDFPGAVARALQEEQLKLVGLDACLPRRTRTTDQATIWHQRYYRAFDDWRALYVAFIREQVARRFSQPFYYQAVPTLRVHLPGNVAVGAFHTDSDYGHPPHELSFWLPLTAAWDSNSIWIESQPGLGDFQPVRAVPGDMVVFEATRLRHGNRINKTGATRISIDFRCLRQCDYTANDCISVSAGMAFAPGAYYADEVVEPRA